MPTGSSNFTKPAGMPPTTSPGITNPPSTSQTGGQGYGSTTTIIITVTITQTVQPPTKTNGPGDTPPTVTKTVTETVGLSSTPQAVTTTVTQVIGSMTAPGGSESSATSPQGFTSLCKSTTTYYTTCAAPTYAYGHRHGGGWRGWGEW
ncbi:hypothetical protein D0862_02470 [Hortaea werneckii]|uniref:Uncharacterized protein n=1 Tax=Hortaea werneckii TaxID=91943 RepID=A0A3M7HID6_HORWE|nr:hypothetical protein D0862_02470 [Hortaea werneckii]